MLFFKDFDMECQTALQTAIPKTIAWSYLFPKVLAKTIILFYFSPTRLENFIAIIFLIRYQEG